MIILVNDTCDVIPSYEKTQIFRKDAEVLYEFLCKLDPPPTFVTIIGQIVLPKEDLEKHFRENAEIMTIYIPTKLAYHLGYSMRKELEETREATRRTAIISALDVIREAETREPSKDSQLIFKAVRKSWSKETCYLPDQNKWSINNRAFGQCAVTSLVIQDFLGGEILHCEHYHHYWNRLPDGTIVDLTKEQFGENANPCQDDVVSREYILESEQAQRVQTLERYLILKNEVQKIINVETFEYNRRTKQ